MCMILLHFKRDAPIYLSSSSLVTRPRVIENGYDFNGYTASVCTIIASITSVMISPITPLILDSTTNIGDIKYTASFRSDKITIPRRKKQSNLRIIMGNMLVFLLSHMLVTD